MAERPIKKLVLDLELESGYNCTIKLTNATYKDLLKLIFKLQGIVLGLPPDLVSWTAHPPEEPYELQYPYYINPMRYAEHLAAEDK